MFGLLQKNRQMQVDSEHGVTKDLLAGLSCLPTIRRLRIARRIRSHQCRRVHVRRSDQKQWDLIQARTPAPSVRYSEY